MTNTQWRLSYLIFFVVGAYFGFATAGPLELQPTNSNRVLMAIMEWGIQHLFALTVLALACLLWPLLTGKAKQSKGLPIYFGIGLCLARLVHGI